MNEHFMSICGNPMDGFLYIGTFPDTESAVLYAERHLKGEEYWINLLDAPSEAQDE